jgi:hypothetical protein
MAAPLKPLERAALITASGATGYALRRTRGGFYSPKQPAAIFTRRVVNWLYERAMIDYDDPQFPTKATLTRRGREQAEALIAQARAKAGAA